MVNWMSEMEEDLLLSSWISTFIVLSVKILDLTVMEMETFRINELDWEYCRRCVKEISRNNFLFVAESEFSGNCVAINFIRGVGNDFRDCWEERHSMIYKLLYVWDAAVKKSNERNAQ